MLFVIGGCALYHSTVKGDAGTGTLTSLTGRMIHGRPGLLTDRRSICCIIRTVNDQLHRVCAFLSWVCLLRACC